MNALLIAAAPQPGSAELVARLAPAADLVVAVDGGGAVCVDAGVSPDLVVGDFDSIDPSVLDWLRSGGAHIAPFPAEKDETDLELALDLMRKRGAAHVLVTAASTGRLDHTLAVLGALSSAADMRAELVEPTVHAWTLSPTGREVLTLDGSGSTFSVFACGAPATVSVTGAKWPLDRYRLMPSIGLGLGNIVTAIGGARVTVHEGSILVVGPQLPDTVQAHER